MQDMNFSSPSGRTQSWLRVFWKSILIRTGRRLIACGGRLSAVGAHLIFKAENDK